MLKLNKKFLWRNIGLLLSIALIGATVVLLFLPHKENIRLLYVTDGSSYDPAAYQNFEQSTIVNIELERKRITDLNDRRLHAYDAVYLDPDLHQTNVLRQAVPTLQRYVKEGGKSFS